MLTPLVLAACAQLAPTDILVPARRMLPEPPGIEAHDVVLADFDGDGDPDVLVGMTSIPNVYLENVGGGQLEPVPSAVPAGDALGLRLVAGDVDLDGDVDALVLGATKDFALYRNAGGAFAFEPLSIPQGGYRLNAGLGDLDQDGDVDAIVSEFYGGVYPFGNVGGALMLASAPLWLTASGSIYDLGLGDLNGDGDLDVLLGGTSEVLLGQGGLSFQSLGGTPGAYSREVELGDLDGDGDLDAYTCAPSNELVHWNDGAAGFTVVGVQTAFGLSESFYSTVARIADVDGDGIVDVVASGWPHASYLRGLGGGAFAPSSDGTLPAPATAHAIALGDLDGDQDLDLVSYAYVGAHARLWLNEAGWFAEAEDALEGPPGVFVITGSAAGDLDGDGYDDLVAAGPSSGGTEQPVWLGGAERLLTLSPGALPVTTSSANSVVLDDVDGDGDLDAALAGAYHHASLHVNDGTGTFTEKPSSFPWTFDGAEDVAFGDVDGDGDPDLLATSSWYATEAFAAKAFRNDGSGSFLTTSKISSGFWPPSVALEPFDVDNDGDLDVAVGGSGTALYLNDGSGVYQDAPGALPAIQQVHSLSSGDVDNDGDLDLFIAAQNGKSTLQINGGGLQFSTYGQWVDESKKTAGAVLVDIDDDLDLDLIFVMSEDPFQTFYENRVYGLEPGGTYQTFGSNGATHPTFLDVDGDGDRELVGGDALVLYTNTTGGQVARRSLPRIGKPFFLDVFAGPGDAWALAYSTGTADVPLGAFGVLKLDPAKLWFAGSGAAPLDGRSGLQIQVPNDPMLVGVPIHWQAVTGAPPTLSNRETTIVTSL